MIFELALGLGQRRSQAVEKLGDLGFFHGRQSNTTSVVYQFEFPSE
jgi:hypothetical protein